MDSWVSRVDELDENLKEESDFSRWVFTNRSTPADSQTSTSRSTANRGPAAASTKKPSTAAKRPFTPQKRGPMLSQQPLSQQPFRSQSNPTMRSHRASMNNNSTGIGRTIGGSGRIRGWDSQHSQAPMPQYDSLSDRHCKYTKSQHFRSFFQKAKTAHELESVQRLSTAKAKREALQKAAAVSSGLQSRPSSSNDALRVTSNRITAQQRPNTSPLRATSGGSPVKNRMDDSISSQIRTESGPMADVDDINALLRDSGESSDVSGLRERIEALKTRIESDDKEKHRLREHIRLLEDTRLQLQQRIDDTAEKQRRGRTPTADISRSSSVSSSMMSSASRGTATAADESKLKIVTERAKSYQMKNRTLEETVRKLRSEKSALEATLRKTHERSVSLVDRIHAEELVTYDLQKKLRQKEEQVATLTQSVAQSQQQLRAMESVRDELIDSDAGSLYQRLADAEDEKQRLVRRYKAEISSLVEECKRLSAECERSNRRLSDLQSQVNSDSQSSKAEADAIVAERTRQQQQQTAAIETERDRLRTRLHDMSQQMAKSEAAREQLHRRTAALESENASLRKSLDIAASQQQLQQQQQQLQQQQMQQQQQQQQRFSEERFEERLRAAEARTVEAVAQNADLGRQLDSERLRAEKSERLLESERLSVASLSRFLDEERARSSQSAATIRGLQDELLRVRASNAEARALADDRDSQIQRLIAANDSNSAATRSRIAELEAEVKRLQQTASQPPPPPPPPSTTTANSEEEAELRRRLREAEERCRILSESNGLLLLRLKREEDARKRAELQSQQSSPVRSAATAASNPFASSSTQPTTIRSRAPSTTAASRSTQLI